MKASRLKIFIDRLKDDGTEQIFESLSPDFLDIKEEELSFEGKVTIAGKAYLAKNYLILELKIKALASLPCSICNNKTIHLIEIKNFTHTIETCKIPTSIYNFSEDVRNSILLNLPQFVECNHDKCPNRKEISKFLKPSQEDTHSPFSEFLSNFT